MFAISVPDFISIFPVLRVVIKLNDKKNPNGHDDITVYCTNYDTVTKVAYFRDFYCRMFLGPTSEISEWCCYQFRFKFSRPVHVVVTDYRKLKNAVHGLITLTFISSFMLCPSHTRAEAWAWPLTANSDTTNNQSSTSTIYTSSSLIWEQKYSVFLPIFVKTSQKLKLCTLCAFVSAQGNHPLLQSTQAYDL
jgi:hypothetical protein